MGKLGSEVNILFDELRQLAGKSAKDAAEVRKLAQEARRLGYRNIGVNLSLIAQEKERQVEILRRLL